MQEFALLAFVLLLALGAWWSLVTFPKQRDFSKRQKVARSLVEGDEIITYGGVIGRVIDIDAENGLAYIEIADGVVIRIITAAIMRRYDPDEIAENAQRGLGTAAEPDPNTGKSENQVS